MEFQKVIAERRSVRRYDPEKAVTKEVVEEIIGAAILAPSWKNSQTARYYCLMTEQTKQELREKCLPEFNAKNVENAPVIIVSTFVKNRSGFEKDGTPTNEAGNGWGYYDLGMHNENLILKAKELGLDTIVMGIRDEACIRELLSIPENEAIVSVIGLGYGIKEPEMPKRKSVSDITKFF